MPQEKYQIMHPRLPVTVAQTLLRVDPQIELPLWLIRMFKVKFVFYLTIRILFLIYCKRKLRMKLLV